MSDDHPKLIFYTIGLVLFLFVLGGCLNTTGPNPDRLTFDLPTALTLDRDETIPYIDIVYESLTEDGVYLIIDGQRALKRKGDSVIWSGSPVTGTEVDLNFRIVWHTEEQIHLAGKALIVVENVVPRINEAQTSSDLSFSGPVAYGVATSSYIPGTGITYQGVKEEGAELGGLFNEYPYRQIGDSILWEGQLRHEVYLRLELRTVQYDSRGLRVAGIATVWLGS